MQRARAILLELEKEGVAPVKVAIPQPQQDEQISMLDLSTQQVCDALHALSVETLTPIEAMNELYKLKKMLD